MIFIVITSPGPGRKNKNIIYFSKNLIAQSLSFKMVNNMKSMGISVLSYFITDSSYRDDRESFTNMYGKDAEFIHPTNMMQVAKTMNEKFLTKG